MKVANLRTNHLQNPLGFGSRPLRLSWTVEQTPSKQATGAQVCISTREDFSTLCYDSGRRADIPAPGFAPPFAPQPQTRYYWRVQVWGDAGDNAVSETAWFETAKGENPWQAGWITSPYGKKTHPLFFKTKTLAGPVRKARVYASGLGLYELYVNGKKAGDEYLAPLYNDYHNWVQYQTYDITPLLKKGHNGFAAMLGNGWYKGRFGFVPGLDGLYGDAFHFIAEIHLEYEDGGTEVVCTGPDWLCARAPVTASSIYDGEEYDARLAVPGWWKPGFDTAGLRKARASRLGTETLRERLSPPVRVMQRIKPRRVLRTPAGEDVLDFGQLLTGWVEFRCHLPAGAALTLQHGELLQNGNFYTENLRTAKQAYRYTSDGTPRKVRPYFTFYGFRYVKITGLSDIKKGDFTACVLYSDLAETGRVETSHKKVNRLIQNALWGQRGNFLDVPTDCPQRDERMGWTGDAQVFAATASFNMETPAFYAKYLHDMLLEQRQLGGAVPHVVPDALSRVAAVTGTPSEPYGSCAWGDAATVIPWTLYQFYGDEQALAVQYENMKLWTDFIRAQDEADGGHRLWRTGFHYADWLALDNPEQGSSFGRTDPYFVASCYYSHSARLTAKAAAALGRTDDERAYTRLADEVREAIRREYYTETGRLAIDTQTAHVLALQFGIAPPQHEQRTLRDLLALLDKRDGHLDTGFVGTAYLCNTLSRFGRADYAYTLLLNEDYPSWLYEVNMGATTIWERWNSVLPNGLVSDTGMNSMNHYAYGAIVEWMYRYMCGLNPSEQAPGFVRADITPQPDARLAWAGAEYRSAAGLYKSGWRKTPEGYLFEVEIPFGATASFRLPGAPEFTALNRQPCTPDADGRLELAAGAHSIQAAYPGGVCGRDGGA